VLKEKAVIRDKSCLKSVLVYQGEERPRPSNIGQRRQKGRLRKSICLGYTCNPNLNLNFASKRTTTPFQQQIPPLLQFNSLRTSQRASKKTCALFESFPNIVCFRNCVSDRACTRRRNTVPLVHRVLGLSSLQS